MENPFDQLRRQRNLTIAQSMGYFDLWQRLFPAAGLVTGYEFQKASLGCFVTRLGRTAHAGLLK